MIGDWGLAIGDLGIANRKSLIANLDAKVGLIADTWMSDDR
jgi:hypothetical protein